MADGYEVDPVALDGLIHVLEDAATFVREANAELGGMAGLGRPEGFDELMEAAEAAEGQRLDLLGNEALAGAAAEFADKWQYGLDKLDEAAEEVIGRLRETRQTYVGWEQEDSNLFERLLPGIDDSSGGQSGISDVLDGGS